MIVLSVDPDDVPGMTVFDPFFRIVPTDGDNIFHDEYCAIGARSCYEYARQLADCGNACDAVAYADKAAEYARQGIYSNNDILAKSILLSHEQALHLS